MSSAGRCLTERQRRVLQWLKDGGWLRANIDFVHIGYDSGIDAQRVLRNTFNSLHDRKLIRFNGTRKNGRSFYDITPAGLSALSSHEERSNG